jgi:hypothetical protein
MHRPLSLLALLLLPTLGACATDSEVAGSCIDGVWQGNATADDLDALAGCAHVAGNLYLWDAEVDDLSALHALESVSGALSILGSHRLHDLAGLERLEHIGGCLEIADNDGLYGLRGADALRRAGCLMVGRSVPSGEVFGNPALVSLDGLGQLAEVDGDLVIAHNPSLSGLSGLCGLERLGGQELVIHHNAQLPNCSAEQLAERLNGQGYAGEVSIGGNDEEAVCPQ